LPSPAGEKGEREETTNISRWGLIGENVLSGPDRVKRLEADQMKEEEK